MPEWRVVVLNRTQAHAPLQRALLQEGALALCWHSSTLLCDVRPCLLVVRAAVALRVVV